MSDELATIKVFLGEKGKPSYRDISSRVVYVDVEDHDRLTDVAKLRMDDPASGVSEVIREGDRITINMGWTDENADLFVGIVDEIRSIVSDTQQGRIEVRAYDLSDQLDHRVPQAALPPEHFGTLSSIVKALYGRPEYGLTEGIVKPDPDPEIPADHPIVQVAMSDLKFVQELARRYCCRTFVEVDAGVPKFYFQTIHSLNDAEPMGALNFCRGNGHLLTFNYHRVGSGSSGPSSTVVEDPASGAATAHDAPPSDEPPSSTPSSRQGVQERLPQYDAAFDAANSAQVNAADRRPRPTIRGLPSSSQPPCQIAADPTRKHGFQGSGEAIGTVFLRAKGKVTLSGLASWANGDWYVTKVNHVFERVRPRGQGMAERRTYRTKFVATR